jgi:hypothetical protein
LFKIIAETAMSAGGLSKAQSAKIGKTAAQLDAEYTGLIADDGLTDQQRATISWLADAAFLLGTLCPNTVSDVLRDVRQKKSQEAQAETARRGKTYFTDVLDRAVESVVVGKKLADSIEFARIIRLEVIRALDKAGAKKPRNATWPSPSAIRESIQRIRMMAKGAG